MNVNRLFCLEVRITKRRSVVEAKARVYVTVYAEKSPLQEE